MPPTEMLRVAYEDVRRSLTTGMIALSRPGSLEGRIITDVTRVGHSAPWQRYSHATMLGWCSNVLMLAETRQHADARLIAASEEFRQWPGYYDIYRVRTRTRLYDPQLAWEFMLRAAGTRYGYNHISRVFVRRHLGHCLLSPLPNSADPRYPRDCSALIHRAVREAGCPGVLTYDCDVTPQHLCDPGLSVYMFTIASVGDVRLSVN